MLSIVLVIVIWTCNLMPLWANIVCTCLLTIRFVWRLMLTVAKFLGQAQDIASKPEPEYYYRNEE